MRTRKILNSFLVSMFCLWLSPALAATLSENESWKVFDDQTVAEARVIITPEYLNYILDPINSESDSLFPATFIFKNSAIPGDTLLKIGFRIRGNTSRHSRKKSFKIDINHFVTGRQFYGLEKINLNGEHNDPSIIRSKLCWDLFNRIQIPASRASHVKLFINDQYFGIYIHVEHIDDEFVQKRFGNQQGNLFKCLWPADLVYQGQEQSAYKTYYGGRQAYELKTNQEADDYADLAHFIDVLNNTPQEKFRREIEKVFHVDIFLKWLALNVLLGSWDDYWYLKNNFYLYHNPASGKFVFIPYDYDNTYGIDWVGGDWGTRSIYNWGHPEEPRPLATRILSVAEYRNKYTQNLTDLINGQFAFAAQDLRIDSLKSMITAAAEADSFRRLDYGFSVEDFHLSYTQSLPGVDHVDYGLKPYIQTRITGATSQLRKVNTPPEIKEVNYTPEFPTSENTIFVTANVVDDQQVRQVTLFYQTTAAEFTPLEMYDDGTNGDALPDDAVWGATIPSQSEGTVLYFYVEAQDNNFALTREPGAAPNLAYFCVAQNQEDSDIKIKLHFKKQLNHTDFGIGLLGNFNNWNRIFPMQETAGDFWEISFYLPPDDYIYKFITFQNLAGQTGVTKWMADPEIPERDGAPYFNTLLHVANPMIYYVKPANQDTVTSFQPAILAEFACSRRTSILPNSISLKIDDQPVENVSSFYDSAQKKLNYIPASPLIPGTHSLFISLQNSAGEIASKLSEFYIERPMLFINEFMAKNDAAIVDEFGEHDDWIELYNAGTVALDLDGLYLTDNFSTPKKWTFPAVTLEAGSFLLVWTDGDANQGPLHTNFKLSANGEQLGIFATDKFGNFPIDTLTFKTQSADISFGRFPDGARDWDFMTATPGAANQPGMGVPAAQAALSPAFKLAQNYPNPFNPYTVIRFTLPQTGFISLKIYNISGRLIKTGVNARLSDGIHSFQWNSRNEAGEPVASGIYFYQIQAETFSETRKMLLIR